MKVVLLLTLSFFLPLFAFLTNLPLAFSDDAEQVVDISDNPISPDGTYYIMPAVFGKHGGVRLVRTGNSLCPLTVLQGDAPWDNGLQVKFKILGTSPGIFTGTELEIELAERTLCSQSSKWSVFVDYEFQEACVGIGDISNHPGQQMLSGTFHIEKHGLGYKLVYCNPGSSTCLDIGTFDANKKEGGRRLNLTEHEPYEFVFLDASKFDGIIKSVV